MSATQRALWQVHRKALDVPLLLVAASVALFFGLRLPLILVEKAVFLSNEYSVWTGVVGLWEDRSYLLAAVVFFFSFVFPIAKLFVLGWIWFAPTSATRRRAWLRHLENLGRWSMLDVFVVAILIVATKLGPLADVSPRPGIYWFCSAILASMLATIRVRRLAAD